MSDDEAVRRAIGDILAAPRSLKFEQLRDRAAYLYITGAHPSHMRTFFTRALVLSSRMTKGPCGLDGLSGCLRLDEGIAIRLDLENHPMVLKVRELIRAGYRIRPSRGPNARRPYGSIFLWRGDDQITIDIKGAILDHWPEP